MKKQQNTQQPVAWTNSWADANGQMQYEIKWLCDPIAGELLYLSPPAPRDVLMAFAEEVRSGLSAVVCDSSEPWVASSQFDLDAIADRYASRVQPERSGVTLEEVVSKLKAGENGDAISEAMTQATADMALGRAIREGRAKQPEPVNQQLLAALKSLVDMDVAYQRGPKVEQAVEVARVAIAAAEAAQPVGQPIEWQFRRKDWPEWKRWQNISKDEFLHMQTNAEHWQEYEIRQLFASGQQEIQA